MSEERVARVLALLAELSETAEDAHDRYDYAGEDLQMMGEHEKFCTLQDAIKLIKEGQEFVSPSTKPARDDSVLTLMKIARGSTGMSFL